MVEFLIITKEHLFFIALIKTNAYFIFYINKSSIKKSSSNYFVEL